MARSRRTHTATIAGTGLALIGTLCGIGPLFWRGWAHLRVTFAAQDTSGARVFRRLGIDVDRPIAAIAEREINRAVPSTLWEVQGHPFQIVAALLLLAPLLVILAARMRRGQRFMCGGALLASVAATVLTVIACIRIRARFDALPDTIDNAIRASGVLSQVVGYTTGKPQVTGSVSWPIIAAAAGIGCTLLGTALAFAASLRATRSPAILPRPGEREQRAKEAMDGDTGRPHAVSDD